MKKFLSIFSIVLLLCCAMVPSASAFNFGGVNASDKVLQAGTTDEKTLRDWWLDNGQPHIIFYQDSGTGVNQLFYTSGNVTLKQNNGQILASGSGYVYNMILNSSNQWQKGSYTQYLSGGYSTYQVAFADGVKWSALDIPNNDGSTWKVGDTNFTEPPLAEMVLELTGEELVTVAIPEMVGAMKVLVPCGVGLMALLVVLKLFGKRSLIFRS